MKKKERRKRNVNNIINSCSHDRSSPLSDRVWRTDAGILWMLHLLHVHYARHSGQQFDFHRILADQQLRLTSHATIRHSGCPNVQLANRQEYRRLVRVSFGPHQSVSHAGFGCSLCTVRCCIRVRNGRIELPDADPVS